MYELMFRSKSINRFGSPRDVSGDKGSDSEGEIGAGRKDRHSSGNSSEGSDIVRARQKYGKQTEEPGKVFF